MPANTPAPAPRDARPACTSTSTTGHTLVDRPGSEYTAMSGERRIWLDCTVCGNVATRLLDEAEVAYDAWLVKFDAALAIVDMGRWQFDAADVWATYETGVNPLVAAAEFARYVD